MKKLGMKKWLCVLCVLDLTLCCAFAQAEEDEIMKRVEQMTLREKVGQLFVIRPDALDGQFDLAELEDNSIVGTVEVTEQMKAFYAQYPCGGFAVFRKNITSPDQLTALIRGLTALGDLPCLTAIDEEGGRIARIANHPAFQVKKFPTMGKIGWDGDPNQAYELGKTIGAYLREYGLSIDFAPVADVNTNPKNTVIGDRAFGSDPAAAAVMVQEVVKGLHESGVAACVKHFPGHGDTSTDTHTGYAETLKTWDEIKACEMIPFQAGMDAGCDLVMTAHIAAPNVTGSDEPSTMSSVILTEKLRGEMGYQGLIITDALSMGAIKEKYTSSEACVACVKAGVDLLLMPYDYVEAFEGVLRAVEAGEISEERINESVYRVLALKQKYLGL